MNKGKALFGVIIFMVSANLIILVTGPIASEFANTANNVSLVEGNHLVAIVHFYAANHFPNNSEIVLVIGCVDGPIGHLGRLEVQVVRLWVQGQAYGFGEGEDVC